MQGQQRPFTGNAAAQNAAGADKQLSQTATIRNAVNVQKSSIAAMSSADDPGKLVITFKFDASAPCMCAAQLLSSYGQVLQPDQASDFFLSRVSVFVAAREEVTEACKLIPSKQPVAAGTHFEKGVRLAAV